MSIRSLLTDKGIEFTPADRKLARVLLANYPAAGLNTVVAFSAAAGVSPPSVVRFVNRLGFPSYPEFQRALLAEVEERMNSPLEMLDAGKGMDAPEGIYQEVLHATSVAVEQTGLASTASDVDEAVRLLTDENASVFCLGGRFSGYLAGSLWAHLNLLRPGCRLITGATADRVDRIADIRRRDVLAVYDYRRYQMDTISLARAAAEQGARILLFTDRWQSPIAELAKTILTVPVESPTPFDTMVPALAQTEALVGVLTARLAQRSRARFERIEALRRQAGITEFAPDPASGPASAKPDGGDGDQ
ncbi:MurR/RpiR family transcriptional regulator [Acidimangrovimonas pyrenivorans]|uniref:MurR/RpiR family transcriptional regulator n=1 Tax=Acidimangrovimonas pyrenivorans TaxID=2030798 RepID=A0ABV7AGP8_9RHOB